MAKNIFTGDRDDARQSAKLIAFVHHKGGTGKTTSCLNIAGWLARMRKKVLVVDLDPQGNATAGLGVDRASLDSTISDVLFKQRNIEEVVLETNSGVQLAPSSLDLLAAETHMAGQIGSIGILREKLSAVEEYFDYILIDVPPGSTLLMINGMVASKNIIVPLDSGVFAYETMETLKTLVIDLHKEVGVEINVMMMLLRQYANTFFDSGPTIEIRKLLKNFLADNNIPEVGLFTIPFSRKIYRAQMRGVPISHYAPFSDVGRAYRRITKEILKSE